MECVLQSLFPSSTSSAPDRNATPDISTTAFKDHGAVHSIALESRVECYRFVIEYSRMRDDLFDAR